MKKNILELKNVSFSYEDGKKALDGVSVSIYAGEKICNKKQRKKLQENVGIVFQDTDSQIIASTVKSEIAFGPMNMNLTREQVETYTMDAIRQMDLEVDRPPHYLSGGEKKKGRNCRYFSHEA